MSSPSTEWHRPSSSEDGFKILINPTNAGIFMVETQLDLNGHICRLWFEKIDNDE